MRRLSAAALVLTALAFAQPAQALPVVQAPDPLHGEWLAAAGPADEPPVRAMDASPPPADEPADPADTLTPPPRTPPLLMALALGAIGLTAWRRLRG